MPRTTKADLENKILGLEESLRASNQEKSDLTTEIEILKAELRDNKYHLNDAQEKVMRTERQQASMASDLDQSKGTVEGLKTAITIVSRVLSQKQ